MLGGDHNRIVNCTIRNVGVNGVFIGHFSKQYYGPDYFLGAMFENPLGVSGGGKDHVVEDCEIYNVGYGGVFVAAGDRITLDPGNVVVRNNYIHHASEHAHDSGAIYSGRDVSFLGNIIRYNFMHDIGEKGNPHNLFAIYLDDKTSGTLVSGNVIVRTGNSGLKLSGGYMNVIENNIFVDVPAIFIFNNYGREAFLDFVTDPEQGHGLRRKLEMVNYQQPPYSERWPELKDIHTKGLPENIVRGNLLLFRLKERGPGAWIPKAKDGVNGGWVAAYLLYGKYGEYGKGDVVDRVDLFPDNFVVNTSLEGFKDFDPGFVDEANFDYRLKPDSPVLKELPDLKNIPFEEMFIWRLSG